MTNKQQNTLDVAQALASLAESQRMMLEAIQSVNARIDALEQQAAAPAEKDAPKTEKTAPKTSNPKANWPKWAQLPNVVPNGYTPLFGVTVSKDEYIQGYGFSHCTIGKSTFIVMKGFGFDKYISKDGKEIPPGSRGKPIRLSLEQWTAVYHVLKASLKKIYGNSGIPSASVSLKQEIAPAPAEETDYDNIDPTNFVCPLCGQKDFKTKGGIRRHYSTKHKGLDCPVS